VLLYPDSLCCDVGEARIVGVAEGRIWGKGKGRSAMIYDGYGYGQGWDLHGFGKARER